MSILTPRRAANMPPVVGMGDLRVDEPVGLVTPPDNETVGAALEADPRSTLVRYQHAVIMTDALAALVASVCAYAITVRLGSSPAYLAFSLLMPLVWVLLVALLRGYERRFLGSGAEEYRRVMDAGLLLLTVIAVGSFAVRADVSRLYVFTAVPLTVVTTLASRYFQRDQLFRLRKRGRGLERVLVVGRADAAAGVIATLNLEPHHGLLPVGACLPSIGEISISHVKGVPVVGDPTQVLEAVEITGAHTVAVVSHPDLSGNALRRLSWALEERGVDLIVSPGIVEVAGPRLSIRPVAGLSLLHMERPSVNGGRLLFKSALDRCSAALLLLVLAPVFVLIGCAIRLTSEGPVFFRQTRIGVNGREFTMIKFRSMVIDAEARRASLREHNEGNAVLFKVKRDPRITRVGGWLRRTSLDELPQLINVFRGEMSLVGPRPPLPEEVAGYTDDAVRRLRVRPGLTGLWQVSGRSDLSWEESLRLDLRYVDNWSIALDLSIMWRTMRAVVKGSGAY